MSPWLGSAHCSHSWVVLSSVLSWCSDFDSRKQGMKGRVVKDDPRRYPDKESIGIFGEDGGHIVRSTEALLRSSKHIFLHDPEPGASSCCTAESVLSIADIIMCRTAQTARSAMPWQVLVQLP